MRVPIKVFICYKKVLSQEIGDKTIQQKNSEAGILTFALQKEADRFEPWMDESDLASGMAWEKEIYRKLLVSDILLVLVGPGTSKSQWVRREIALATALGISIVPLGFDLDRSEMDKELSALDIDHLQGKITNNIKLTTMVPLINEIVDDLESASQRTSEQQKEALQGLLSRFRPQSLVAFHNRYLDLTVNPKELQPDKIPEDSEIESDRISLEIFDLQENPPRGGNWKWRQIVDWAKNQGDTDWLSEVAQSVQWACKGKVQRPIKKTITHPETKKKYRPNVHRREIHPNGLMTLQILFIHQPWE